MARFTMRYCIVRKCDNYTLAGFRKCPQCMGGMTPDKRGEEE